MKKLLLSLATLFLMGGASLSAQEKVYADFSNVTTADNASWDAETQTLSWTGTWSNSLNNIGLPKGDITIYEKIVVDCEMTEGTKFRVLIYKGGSNVALHVTQTGVTEFILTDEVSDVSFLQECTEICLSGATWSNGGTAPGSAKINSVYLVKSSDPLAGTKKILNDMLTVAKNQVEFGKTAASFAALTTEIANAEAALAAAGATKESLESATNNLQTAIDGLTLLPGYTNLTKEMFMEHTTFGGEGTVNTSCVYGLNTSTDLPYGLGSVNWLNYADLSAYDQLVVVVSGADAAAGRQPRFCFNRTVNEGQDNEDEAQSKMIDIPGKSWGTTAYETVDGNAYTIDLAKMATDKEFAYLHCIKGNGWQVTITVTDMLLYKAPKELTSSAELQGYKTFYDAKNNYQVDANTTIYKATAVSKTSVSLQAVEGKIVPKGTPVILKTTNTTDYKISLTLTAEAATADFSGNLLKAALVESTNLYILAYTTADGLGFFKYTDALTPGQVYVDVPAEAKGRLMIDEEDEAMAISELASDEEEDGVAYNLAGQPVGDDYKGIVIKNGKKYLQK